MDDFGSGLLVLLITVLVMLGFYYGIVPLMVRSSAAISAELTPAATELETLEPLASQGIRRLIQQLDGLGFEVLANVRSSELVEYVTSVRLLLASEARGTWVDAFYVSAKRPVAKSTETWTLALRTRFADGFDIVTASSDSPAIYPIDPQIDAINPFWITDAAVLLTIHEARIERCPHRAQGIVMPMLNDPLAFIREDYRSTLDRLAEAGYYRLDLKTNRYWPTAKGAYLMTWRMLWPLKPIRRRSRIRQTQRVLRELGLGHLATASEARASEASPAKLS